MRLKKSLSLTLLPLFLCATALASDVPPEASTADAVTRQSEWQAPTRRLDFGLNIQKFDYAEQLTLPTKSTENGTLVDYDLALTLQPSRDSAFLKGAFSMSLSSTHYLGTSEDGTQTYSNPTTNRFIEGELEAGTPNLIPGRSLKALQARLYVGAGIRGWDRGSIYDSPHSYEEDYSWYYLPIGARLEFDVSDRLKIGADVSGNYDFGGAIVVKYSQISTTPDQNANLGAKWGWKAQLPVTFAATPELAVIISPWYESSAIGQSNDFYFTMPDDKGVLTDYVGHEPSSRTTQYGFQALMGLGF